MNEMKRLKYWLVTLIVLYAIMAASCFCMGVIWDRWGLVFLALTLSVCTLGYMMFFAEETIGNEEENDEIAG